MENLNIFNYHVPTTKWGTKKIHHMDLRGAYDKFPDFFRMGTFIDSTRMKL